MDSTLTEREPTPAVDSIDDLAKGLARGTVSRRRTLLALGASIFGGTLGSLALADDAAAKKNRRNRRRNNNKPKPVPPPPPLPPGQPSASQNCLAAGNQCGTFANQQGTCRVPAATDNQAGFVCTSNQAGNACAASNQCGANTRCVIQGAAQNCRVVIA
jgi:hypothetical protein